MVWSRSHRAAGRLEPGAVHVAFRTWIRCCRLRLGWYRASARVWSQCPRAMVGHRDPQVVPGVDQAEPGHVGGGPGPALQRGPGDGDVDQRGQLRPRIPAGPAAAPAPAGGGW